MHEWCSYFLFQHHCLLFALFTRRSQGIWGVLNQNISICCRKSTSRKRNLFFTSRLAQTSTVHRSFFWFLKGVTEEEVAATVSCGIAYLYLCVTATSLKDAHTGSFLFYQYKYCSCSERYNVVTCCCRCDCGHAKMNGPGFTVSCCWVEVTTSCLCMCMIAHGTMKWELFVYLFFGLGDYILLK